MLDDKQKRALDLVINGKTILLTGMAGTGKSHLIKLISELEDKSVAITALTGTAANLICGLTLHKWGGLPINPTSKDQIIRKIKTTEQLINNWKLTDILIIDEVSMMTPEMLNQMNYISQVIRENSQFMGGLQVIFCGDFAQLPPVNCKEFLFESTTWKNNVKDTIYLTTIYRQSDPLFQKILAEVRLSNMSKDTIKYLQDRVILGLSEPEYNGKETLQQKIGLETMPPILYPYKKDVSNINKCKIDELITSGVEYRTYPAVDTLTNKYMKDLFDQLDAPKSLTLTIGTLVLLTVNLDISSGLCNGSSGIITGFTIDDHPLVKFGDNIREILPYTTTITTRGGYISRKQYPLAPSWAISVHKSQGMTLDTVIADMTDCFDYGQTYVTLSRVKTIKGLYLLGLSISGIKCHPKVKKFYEELTEKGL